MEGGLKLGHVLLKVNTLREAMFAYESRGFSVAWGADPRKAYNAFIYLQDGVFIELFEMNPGPLGRLALKLGASVGHGVFQRFYRYVTDAPGWVDYAVDLTGDFDAAVMTARQNGVKLSNPVRKSRVDAQGARLRWKMAIPTEADLPFLMSAYQPALSPAPADLRHGNGAVSLQTIVVETSAWAITFDRYRRLFGAPAWVAPNQKEARFDVAPATVRLVAGAADGIREVVVETRLADSAGEMKKGIILL